MEPDASHYRNFRVAVYIRAQEVEQMADASWLQARWDLISRQVHIDKVYIETHRDLILVDQPTLANARRFFNDRGIPTAGGITLTVDEPNRFQTFCYTTPEHRQQVRQIVEHTAKNFDEIILDDFFFTNCKCERCIAAKGEKSWTEFRLDLMNAAARELVIAPAKAANPRVKLVIKYPNWYEHFQALGFDLANGPQLFDGIYTGTETRHPVHNAQHLQQYHGYSIVRYFENIDPGRNGGGWVDTGGLRYADRYAEQLWLTLFAKAQEITLFDFRQLLRPIEPSQRAGWQGSHTSFNFDEMAAPFRQADGTFSPQLIFARAAGCALEKIDPVLDKLGRPVGLKSYKPHHSGGEDFLASYLGMIGLPIELVPEFPNDATSVLLAESAACDEQIVPKIKRHLLAGNTVVITSGLLAALANRGIRDIVEIKCTDRKTVAREFYRRGSVWHGETPILLPQIEYPTNEAWELIGAGANGSPLLLMATYGIGRLLVLTVPDNFADLYHLPPAVLNMIRAELLRDLPLRIEGPSQVAIFMYDNGTFAVESFRDEEVDVTIATNSQTTTLRNVMTNETIAREVRLRPHSFCVLSAHQTASGHG